MQAAAQGSACQLMGHDVRSALSSHNPEALQSLACLSQSAQCVVPLSVFLQEIVLRATEAQLEQSACPMPNGGTSCQIVQLVRTFCCSAVLVRCCLPCKLTPYHTRCSTQHTEALHLQVMDVSTRSLRLLHHFEQFRQQLTTA